MKRIPRVHYLKRTWLRFCDVQQWWYIQLLMLIFLQAFILKEKLLQANKQATVYNNCRLVYYRFTQQSFSLASKCLLISRPCLIFWKHKITKTFLAQFTDFDDRLDAPERFCPSHTYTHLFANSLDTAEMWPCCVGFANSKNRRPRKLESFNSHRIPVIQTKSFSCLFKVLQWKWANTANIFNLILMCALQLHL